jgi:hypothetical protein
MRRGLAGLIASVALAGCGSSTTVLDTSEATALFRKDTAAHYHGTVALNDIEPPNEPVVPTDDGRGCTEGSPERWTCTAYVYMNEPNGPNYDVTGSVAVEGESINYHAHATTDP